MTESYEKDDYLVDLVNFNSPASSHHHHLHHLSHGHHGGTVNQYYGSVGGSGNSSNNTSINGHADGDIPAEEDEMLLWRSRRLVDCSVLIDA